MKRCIQCDIPLVVRPCPNPQCEEIHGASVGDLCTWCSQRQDAYLELAPMAAWQETEPEPWAMALLPA